MRIALYRGKGIVSKLILWQSRGKFSHAAVVLADNSVIESKEGSLSPLWRGGVRRRAHYLPIEGETCTLFDVMTTPVQEREIVNFLQEQIGKGYDYLSILRFITRQNTNSYTRGTWFCSELVFSAFRHAGINLLSRIDAWAVSPGQLATSPFLKEI